MYSLHLLSQLTKTELVTIIDPNVREKDSLLGYVPWNDNASVLGAGTLVELVDENPACFRLTKFSNCKTKRAH